MLDKYGCSLHGTLEEGNHRFIHCHGQTTALCEYLEAIHGYHRQWRLFKSREGFLFCISVRAMFISTRDLDAGLKSGCVNVRGLNICLYCIKKISQDCMNTFQNCNVTFHYFFFQQQLMMFLGKDCSSTKLSRDQSST